MNRLLLLVLMGVAMVKVLLPPILDSVFHPQSLQEYYERGLLGVLMLHCLTAWIMTELFYNEKHDSNS